MVHGGVKRRGRRGNEVNWTRKKEAGEMGEVKTQTQRSAVRFAGGGTDSVSTNREV